MKKWLLASVLLSVLLVLAACGGTGKEDNTGSSEDATASTEVNITGKNFEFDHAEYTVKAGEKVKITYKNEEGMHGIAIDGLDVDIKGDGEATLTPTEPGEYTIYCNIPCGAGHADMKSTLIVT
ncbi:cupredoxin domain-containing protein [Sporosarcina sp. FSL K6-1508]|uniref:cupredoxin domain-containing protein n=1 Tax=Sporosarcina sp. FSL K6-1508 TaxID=2921553 RepID=UPI0030FC370F